jgi:threonine dehydrogenase-like Zn-dependent dehydrogenase
MNATASVLTAPKSLELREIPLPEVNADNGLLRVEACGLCGSDYEQWKATKAPEYNKMPIIPGHEIIGRIEKAGKNALNSWGLEEGQRVAVEGVIPCGSCPACTTGTFKRCVRKRGYGIRLGLSEGSGLWGGYASHVYLESGTLLHPLPEDVPTGVMVLFNPLSNGVRWVNEVGGVTLGSTVVICGPGQRGLLSVIAAREAGADAIYITGTRKDVERIKLAKELGATATINVDEEDPVAVVNALTKGKGVDVVVDVSHLATEPIVQAIEMVRPGGRIVLGGLKHMEPVPIVTDKLAYKEVTMVGVFSAGYSAIETAIKIISKNWKELEKLNTHTFPIERAEHAIRLLGREITDTREPISINLTPA